MAKKKPAKHPGGRWTLYRAEMCDLVERLCLLGLKDEELAHSLKITERTLNRWKLAHPEFCQSIQNGRENADGNVARALYFRAIGAVVHRQQPFKVKKVYYDDQGRRCEEERVVIAEFDDQVPPDTAAAFIWLKNRRKDKWSDKPVPESDLTYKDLFEKVLKGSSRLWDSETKEAVRPEEVEAPDSDD